MIFIGFVDDALRFASFAIVDDVVVTSMGDFSLENG